MQRACLRILDLLSDGRPHAWHELQAVGGSRANARVGELRRAGYVIQGPRPWRSLSGIVAPIALRDGVEVYRLVQA